MEIVKECPKHGQLTKEMCFLKVEKRWKNQTKKYFSCKQCKKESEYKYRAKPGIKQVMQEKRKSYTLKNIDRLRKYKKDYTAKNRERITETERIRRKRNIEHTRNLMREQQKKWRDSLDDNYIKSQLRSKYKVKQKDVPTWMIEIKREIIKLRRKIREIKSGN